MSILPMIILLLGLLLEGCSQAHSHNVRLSPNAQAGRYIETEGLSQLPNRRLVITSFGIEFDTKLLFPSVRSHHHPFGGEIHTVQQLDKEVTLGLANDQMQSLADQVYTQLLEDLQAAGYDIVPYNMYRELPAYRSLVELTGTESQTPITFKLGDPTRWVQGEALVFAPNGLNWYSPALGEIGSRLRNTLARLGSDNRLTRRSLLGREAVSQAEFELANALNATLVKAYYVVSPLRRLVEDELLAGALPTEGKTIVGQGETRLALRTPDASTGYHHFTKNTPPRDGNAFVRLQRDVTVDDDLTSNQTLETHLEVISKLFILAMMAER